MSHPVAHIQMVLQSHIRDVEGEKVADDAAKYFGLQTGRVKYSKIFSVVYNLPEQQMHDFANLCLKDAVINEVNINEFYHDPGFAAFITVAKLPGVTDDEGMSAQKSLADFLNIRLDTNTQHIYTKEVFLLEQPLKREQLRTIAENLLGNKLIHHFEYGAFADDPDGRAAQAFEYVPEVLMHTHNEIETVNIFVSAAELLQLSKTKVLSLNLEEMQAIQAYYRDPAVQAKRQQLGLSELPTDCELEILAQTWSEHCKHKEFSAVIHYENAETGETKEIDSLFTTYIRNATDIVRQHLDRRAAIAGW